MTEKEIVKQFEDLNDEDIELIKTIDLGPYADFKQSPNDLPYKEFSMAFAKATSKQRGYIHGLSDKLGIDEYGSLPYYVPDIRDLTLFQAAHVINMLLVIKDSMEGNSIF